MVNQKEDEHRRKAIDIIPLERRMANSDAVLIPFAFERQSIRVQLDEHSAPWWVAKDVCDVLEHTDPHKAVSSLDEDERKKVPVIDSLGREQETWAINESGLYTLILRSNKPQAKPFRKWVTSEVLPAIRKTGSYALLLQEDTAFQRYRTRLPSLQTVFNTFTCAIKAGKSVGLAHRQAVLSANAGAVRVYGMDCLNLLGIDRHQIPESNIKKNIAKANAEERVHLADEFFQALGTLPKNEQEKCVEIKEERLMIRLLLSIKLLRSREQGYNHAELMRSLKLHPAFIRSNTAYRGYFGSQKSVSVKVWVFDLSFLSAKMAETPGSSFPQLLGKSL